MARLILHADDLGLHEAVNRAVFEAAEKGVLTSASILVNGQAAEEALAEAGRYPALGIGVHLNILRGRPLSPPSEIASLVARNGRFCNSTARLCRRSLAGRLEEEEVLLEYRRQVQYMLSLGISPTHFDGEKHTHLLLPEAARAVARLAGEFGINRVRWINESPLLRRLAGMGLTIKAGLRQRLKLFLLEYRAARVRSLWRDLRCPAASFGVLMTGNPAPAPGVDLLAALLALPEPETVEWMFHPAYPFDCRDRRFRRKFGAFFLGASGETERRFLMSAPVKAILSARRRQLITYREL